MAAAETMKKTVEQFSTASNQAFKDGVEKSLAALAEANTHSKKNLEAVVASVTAGVIGSRTLLTQSAETKRAVLRVVFVVLLAATVIAWPRSPPERAPCPPRCFASALQSCRTSSHRGHPADQ